MTDEQKRTKNCWDCIYWQGHCENSLCCHYYLITDKRRPCPGGDGCTVKVKRKHKRKMHYDYHYYEKKGENNAKD